MVVKMQLEPNLEPIFLPDSYGYRPGKSALDAVEITRKRCWQYDWVLEFDIKGLFDNIAHALLTRALEKHTECKWVRLYIGRWLRAPLHLAEGTLVERTKGTPQGGVVSPVLANLFLHYAFDVWMTRTFPGVPWCRYADDGLIHCKTEAEALAIKTALKDRFAACGLEMHPDKTQVVYCKDGSRKERQSGDPGMVFAAMAAGSFPRWLFGRCPAKAECKQCQTVKKTALGQCPANAAWRFSGARRGSFETRGSGRRTIQI
jgi:RNA-directed DNA polymerase